MSCSLGIQLENKRRNVPLELLLPRELPQDLDNLLPEDLALLALTLDERAQLRLGLDVPELSGQVRRLLKPGQDRGRVDDADADEVGAQRVAVQEEGREERAEKIGSLDGLTSDERGEKASAERCKTQKGGRDRTNLDGDVLALSELHDVLDGRGPPTSA